MQNKNDAKNKLTEIHKIYPSKEECQTNFVNILRIVCVEF